VDTLADDMSPNGSIEMLHLYNQQLDRYEIWFVDANDSTNIFLFDSTSFQNAEVIFSPNDKWVAENVEVVSNYRTVCLFKRDKGVDFKEVKGAQIEKRAWSLFAKSNHLAALPMYDHTATFVVSWSEDSETLLVEIEGHIDLKHYLSPWYCNYNVRSLAASLNPEKAQANSHSFHR
jgi:hypothetical protein